MKKSMKAVLAASSIALLVSLFASCKDKVGKANINTYKKITYAYCVFTNVPNEKDLDVVEEQLNKITREKIGVEVELLPISIAEYNSKVSLALQGGERIDIFQSLGNFGTCVASEMTYNLTNLLEAYGKETKELEGEQWLNACASDGCLYGIPTYKPVALTPMLIYRKDIADALNIDMTKVNCLDDVISVLRSVKNAYPTMTPLCPTQAGTIGTELTMPKVDYLNDDFYSPVGVIIGDSFEVKDLYTTKEFKKICDFAYYLQQNNLIMKDAATTTTMAADSMSSGNCFAYLASYSYPEQDTAASLQAQFGEYPIAAKIIGDAYLSTTDLNAVSWMIASTTREPEAAMKFLNLTFTDKDVINTLIYGVPGRDYILDNGFVSYPEGQSAFTVPYSAQLSCGTLGNFFLMYPTMGSDPASLEWELEQNKTAPTSPAMGFTFDSSRLKTQYTAVKNVIAQYLPGLVCGSLNPDTEITKFVNALNDAGYNEILAEKQKQLDAWVNGE